jgi:cation diffusion facilitator family transporter
MESIKIAKKVTLVSIVGNVLLSIIKIIAGIIGNSSAMIADGIHSVSDIFTSVIAFLGVKFSAKEEDDDHQYGHEKIELVVSKILALILFGTGAMVAYNAIQVIIKGAYVKPGYIAIYAAILSIGFKEWMYHYTMKGAKAIGSNSLKVDAWNHRTDSLSSVAALIGITGAIFGYGILEPIASVIIAAFIGKVAVDIYIDSVKGLIDTSASEEMIDKIKSVVYNVDGVLAIDLLKTRLHGNKIYVDIEIAADGKQTLNESHEIARKVHDSVENNIEEVKHCMVHCNPKKLND